MNEGDYLAKIKQTESSNQSYLHLQIIKSFLANVFGDFELGAKLALERGDEYLSKNGSPLVMLDFLHQGIALYAMARKTNAKKYSKGAKKVASTISSWAKKVGLNIYILFITACLSFVLSRAILRLVSVHVLPGQR